MKINSFTKSMLVVSSIIIIVIAACKKDNNNNPPPGGGVNDDSSAAMLSGSSAISDNAYNDVLQVALESSSDNKIAYLASMAKDGQVATNSTHPSDAVNGIFFTCATYTLAPADTSTFPKTVTVDFGAGCTSLDGMYRKGKITYVLSGKILKPGTTVTATFTSYSVNGYQIEGTYAITNISTLAGIAYTTKVTDGKITFPDAKYYTYAGNKTVKMIAGVATPSDPTDDVYSITGSHTFGSSTGNTLNDSITTALSKAYTCRYISSGIISFTYNGSINGTVDFGNGTCDSLVTVNVGAFNKSIPLP